MAPAVPVLSGVEVVGVFERLGWTVARQRGSHIILTRQGSRATLSVPDHREVARGTLRAAGHTVDDFVDAVR